MFDTMARDMIQEIGGQIPMRIDDPDPAAGNNVLENQITEQGGLPCSAFPDSIQMMPSISIGKNEGQLLPPMLTHS